MKNTSRISRISSAILLIGVLVSLSLGQPTRTAIAQAGVDWGIESSTTSVQTNTGSSTNITTHQHSSDGQDLTDVQTHEENNDGTAHEHEELTYTDSKGDDWRFVRDSYRDKDGNWKEHTEETDITDGKCKKTITDTEYDRNFVVTKRTVKEGRCTNYSLEVHWEGSMVTKSATIERGPNTDSVPLLYSEGVYSGSFKGEWILKMTTTNGCQKNEGSAPVTIDVKAKENETSDLEFTVTLNVNETMKSSCEDNSGGWSTPVNKTFTFTLPPDDGESVSEDATTGKINTKVTFTLKEKKP